MEKFKIKKGDNVIVTSGKDKGKKGSVTKVLREKNRLIISQVNMVKKHVKPSQLNAGGIIEKEASIHISNVSILCPKTNEPTKVGYKFLEDGKKVRFSKKSGEVIDN